MKTDDEVNKIRLEEFEMGVTFGYNQAQKEISESLKSEAIGFAEWIEKEEYVVHHLNEKDEYVWWSVGTKYYTTDELYLEWKKGEKA